MNRNNNVGICDEKNFSAFFAKHAKSLRNYLYFKFGNEEQANDVTQEAFIKLWENCLNVSPEKAKSFLYTVANNKTLNHIAHQKVKLTYAASHSASHETNISPEFIYEENEFRDKLERAISNLTEAQRVAFLLNRIEGKKYYEIAEMLGIGVKAVEKRIHGALVSLRTEIIQLK